MNGIHWFDFHRFEFFEEILFIHYFAYCKTGNVGQQLSLTKLTLPCKLLNFVLVNQRSPQAVLEYCKTSELRTPRETRVYISLK